jgi:hypothetical protein
LFKGAGAGLRHGTWQKSSPWHQTVNCIPPPALRKLDSGFREFKAFRTLCKAKYRHTAMTAAIKPRRRAQYRIE